MGLQRDVATRITAAQALQYGLGVTEALLAQRGIHDRGRPIRATVGFRGHAEHVALGYGRELVLPEYSLGVGTGGCRIVGDEDDPVALDAVDDVDGFGFGSWSWVVDQ